jgi:hypothetical protein
MTGAKTSVKRKEKRLKYNRDREGKDVRKVSFPLPVQVFCTFFSDVLLHSARPVVMQAYCFPPAPLHA